MLIHASVQTRTLLDSYAQIYVCIHVIYTMCYVILSLIFHAYVHSDYFIYSSVNISLYAHLCICMYVHRYVFLRDVMAFCHGHATKLSDLLFAFNLMTRCNMPLGSFLFPAWTLISEVNVKLHMLVLIHKDIIIFVRRTTLSKLDECLIILEEL